MPVLLAAAKKVVTHHAIGKKENYDYQEYDEQGLCKSEPR
jgi:hypothetical protein